MIEYINGNVFKSKDHILVHGCNCFGVMGAGVASTVKQLYPRAYQVDQDTACGKPSKLGDYSWSIQTHAYYPQQIIIINAYTQFAYSSNSESRNVDYDAIRTVMSAINENFPEMHLHESICMPKIGAGLGGGDWDTISDIINSVFKTRNINVYSI